jgi:hypothetical protein
MWQIPVLFLVGTGVALAAGATKRKPLPADVAGSLRSALQSNNDQTLTTMLGALTTKYPRQTDLIYKAWGATKAHDGTLNVPADIDAMYQAAFHSGDPAQLKTVAASLDVKYHFLSTHLNDIAALLANLATPTTGA